MGCIPATFEPQAKSPSITHSMWRPVSPAAAAAAAAAAGGGDCAAAAAAGAAGACGAA